MKKIISVVALSLVVSTSGYALDVVRILPPEEKGQEVVVVSTSCAEAETHRFVPGSVLKAKKKKPRRSTLVETIVKYPKQFEILRVCAGKQGDILNVSYTSEGEASILPAEIKGQEVVIISCTGTSVLPDSELSAKKKRNRRTQVESIVKYPKQFQILGECVGKTGDILKVSY